MHVGKRTQVQQAEADVVGAAVVVAEKEDDEEGRSRQRVSDPVLGARTDASKDRTWSRQLLIRPEATGVGGSRLGTPTPICYAASTHLFQCATHET